MATPPSYDDLADAVRRDDVLAIGHIVDANPDLLGIYNAYGPKILDALWSKDPADVAGPALHALIERGLNLEPGFAALVGLTELVADFIEADVSQLERKVHGATLMHWAAWGDRTGTIRWLAARGLSVNAVADDGQVPLHKAAHWGHCAAIRTLAELGADLHAREPGGGTPLVWALMRGHTPAADALVSAGVDVNDADGQGRTLLHMAATQGSESMARFLLENGADRTLTDASGKPAYAYVGRLLGRRLRKLLRDGC